MEKVESRDTVSDSLPMETQGQLVGTRGSWNGREEVGEKVGVHQLPQGCRVWSISFTDELYSVAVFQRRQSCDKLHMYLKLEETNYIFLTRLNEIII